MPLLLKAIINMKRTIIFLIGILALVSCDKGENWWGKGPKPEPGVFSFNEKETVITIDKDTKSFRLEGSYLEAPDEKHAGHVGLIVLEEESTALHGTHFLNDETARFSQAENGNFYLDVALFPDNITEEVKITYFVPLYTDDFNDAQKWPNRIGETTVVLRPLTDR